MFNPAPLISIVNLLIMILTPEFVYIPLCKPVENVNEPPLNGLFLCAVLPRSGRVHEVQARLHFTLRVQADF